MNKNKIDKTVKVTKTTVGIRNLLVLELEDFLNGKVDKDHSKTVGLLTALILKSVVIDLAAAKLLNDINRGRDTPKTLANLNLNLTLSNDTGDLG